MYTAIHVTIPHTYTHTQLRLPVEPQNNSLIYMSICWEENSSGDGPGTTLPSVKLLTTPLSEGTES